MRYILLFFIFTTFLSSKTVGDSLFTITFEGNAHVRSSDLEKFVGAKRPSYIKTLWMKDEAKINSILLPKLDETFEHFYKNEGFYDANVSHELGDYKSVKFIIKENRPIIIDKIVIDSNLDISDAILLKEGSRFRAEDFKKMKQSIRKILLSEGYCSPKLDTKAYLDIEEYNATIKITLDKQRICHFGNISIETSSPTMSDDIILSRLQFEEGDVFDINKIKESYESLYALEAFDQLHLDYSLNNFNKKPVKIKYKEIKKHIHSRVGVGYATDLKFQAKYHWEYRNYHGNGKKLTFDTLLSEKQKMVENSFFIPHIFSLYDYHMDFQNSVGYSEERNIHEYDEKVFYDRLYLSHKSSRWYNSIGFGIENRDISNDKTFFLMYPFMKLIYDRRDSKLNPTKGIYFSHEMEYGLPYSPDSTTYLKYLEELRAIYTLHDITLSAVGRMGAIKVYSNDMPESKKFFAGGAFSNRAYSYHRIGIVDKQNDTQVVEGGYTLANLSVETNFPIYNNFRGAIFTDNTMISENQGIWEFSNNVITSVGLGFRYMTPIGPFKIDMGFNVENRRENAVHFQVGQSF
jgi:translocation and assembly module TamA